MCDYISWYEELSGKVHFLTDADLPKARKLGINAEDFKGHGALFLIRGWTPRTGRKPNRCAHCRSPYWDRPRRAK